MPKQADPPSGRPNAACVAKNQGSGSEDLHLSDIGGLLQGPDDLRAKSVLKQAWSLSERQPKPFGPEELDIAESVSAIDPQSGRKLIRQLRDEYWRTLATESFPGWVAVRHPALAATLLSPGNGSLFELLLHLCRIRIDWGIRFAKMIKAGVNENLISDVAYNLPSDDATRFIRAFPIPSPRSPALFWLILHPKASGPELEDAAAEMPRFYDRIDLTLKAIETYRSSNPKRAAELADGLCDEAAARPFKTLPGMSVGFFQ